MDYFNCSYASVDDVYEVLRHTDGIMWTIGATRASDFMGLGDRFLKKRGGKGGTTGIF